MVVRWARQQAEPEGSRLMAVSQLCPVYARVEAQDPFVLMADSDLGPGPGIVSERVVKGDEAVFRE